MSTDGQSNGIIYGAGSNTINTKLVWPSYMQVRPCGMSEGIRQMYSMSQWQLLMQHLRCGLMGTAMVKWLNTRPMRNPDLIRHSSILIDRVMMSWSSYLSAKAGL